MAGIESKKPLPIKITVFLILLYGVLLSLPNFTSSASAGFFSFSLGIYLTTLVTIIISLPFIIPAIFSAMLIWRAKRAGYYVSILLLVIAGILAASGVVYILSNLPGLVAGDRLYFFHSPPSGLNFIFDTSLEHNSYTDSLLIGRYVVIKSYVKAIVEILGFASLLKVVTGSYFTLEKRDKN